MTIPIPTWNSDLILVPGKLVVILYLLNKIIKWTILIVNSCKKWIILNGKMTFSRTITIWTSWWETTTSPILLVTTQAIWTNFLTSPMSTKSQIWISCNFGSKAVQTVTRIWEMMPLKKLTWMSCSFSWMTVMILARWRWLCMRRWIFRWIWRRSSCTSTWKWRITKHQWTTASLTIWTVKSKHFSAPVIFNEA